MPNGGMMPCCLSCTWADKKEMEPLPKVFCTKHKVTSYAAMSLFCSHLSNKFAEREGLLDEMMYMWATVSYKNPEYPTLPQYHHEIMSLISISDYRGWNEEECYVAIRKMNEEAKELFLKKYGK